jgi:hypothetical protein
VRLIKGIIYDKKDAQLAIKTVSPGRILSGEELKTLSADEIRKHFADISPGVIPPKGTIPVMLVFTEIPPTMAKAEVQLLL